MSASFWIGRSNSGTPDATYDDDWVVLGQNDLCWPDHAHARYKDGQIWLGNNTEGIWYEDPDAVYSDGCIWLGRYIGHPTDADAHLEDGCIWLGPRLIEVMKDDPDGRYDGDEEGAAAATVLLLLSGGGSYETSHDDSSEEEYSSTSEYSYSGASHEPSVSTTHTTSPTYTSPDSPWPAFLILALAAGFSFFYFVDTTENSTTLSDPATTVIQPPAEHFDRWNCGPQDCPSGQELVARKAISIYEQPPNTYSVAIGELKKSGELSPGEWVKNIQGFVLTQHHLAQAMRDSTFSNTTEHTPNLSVGETLHLYGYIGEGCWKGWKGGLWYEICQPNLISEAPEGQWWAKILRADHSYGWIHERDSLSNRETLNTELGVKLMNTETPFAQKIEEAKKLIELGADLNGDSGRHGVTPIEGVLATNSIELLQEMMALGLSLDSTTQCVARWSTWYALKPEGHKMLTFLLEHGMKLNCLSGPVLHEYLTGGTDSASYPEEEAIKVAQVLIDFGVSLNQKDFQNKTIFDVLDSVKSPARVAKLKEFLLQLAAERQKEDI